MKIRGMNTAFINSEFIIMVEANLGFESEYHQRRFNSMPNVRFRIDHKNQRYGIMTTEAVKYAMCTMMDTVLREQRLHLCPYFVSRDPRGLKKRLREQMNIYSLQFKSAASVFGKQQMALSGKIGGMKDDVVIALQLGVYFSSNPLLEPPYFQCCLWSMSMRTCIIFPNLTMRTGSCTLGLLSVGALRLSKNCKATISSNKEAPCWLQIAAQRQADPRCAIAARSCAARGARKSAPHQRHCPHWSPDHSTA
eukprot:662954-Hanusia_phi.AAC.2